ncbi:MAG: iron transporter, partial [Clostridia bacterium]|nr:iron transporter [Clostridia bacterium]
MKKFFALLLATLMVVCSLAALAEEAGFEEFPITVDGAVEGAEEEVDLEEAPLHVAAVYFQPVPMEPADQAGLSVEDSNIHLEADIHWNENGYGFGVGDWVPYLTVEYCITNQETGAVVVDWSAFMVMSADDGPHYGANVALPESGTYTLTFRIHSPAENGYLLHVDEETGVPEHAFWSAPIDVNFVNWEYTVQE